MVLNNAIMYIWLNEWRNGKKANLILFAICYHPEIKWISFGFMCILCVVHCVRVCLYNWRDITKNVQCSIQTRSIHPSISQYHTDTSLLVSRDRREFWLALLLSKKTQKTSLKWFHRICISFGVSLLGWHWVFNGVWDWNVCKNSQLL